MDTPTLDLPPAERIEIAAKAGIDEQYLYQCITGRRSMKPKLAVHVESSSGGRVRRWHVRMFDWHETWPDLVGTEGAPPIPTAQAA